ncbi:hypothetical protein BDW62DRAFT_216308 [Aspergillus aurantiobrunneus]
MAAHQLVGSETYTPLGYEEIIGELRTYITGPSDATVGVFCAYDVAGISLPTQQAADFLASALNAIVVVPDLLKGQYAKPEWFPLDSDEKRGAFFGYLKGYAFPKNHLGTFVKLMESCRERFPSVRRWGSYGLCWGGKIVALASKASTPLACSVQAHPGMLDPADAEEITIPHAVLASKDEPIDMVAGFKAVIESRDIPGYVTTYPMFHGWMGSSAKLGDDEARKEYIRGYTELLGFFQKYLSPVEPQ